MKRRWRSAKHAFYFHREYRQVAPYRGFSGEGYMLTWLSVPRYIVECEVSGFTGKGRWMAANPSGAVGPAQLLGWGAPYPADTLDEQLEYWRIAAYVLSIQGLGAWECA